ncbi:hypothetical protein [Tomitella biformata]|nr:hypothetical protein [Tomitella biformata]
MIALAGAMLAVSATPALADPASDYTGAVSLGILAPGAGPAACVPLGL